MDIRFATPDEVGAWNTHILANPDEGNVFQGDEFAEQKKLGNWTPRHIVAHKIAITVLEKPVLAIGKMWYIPKGPGIESTSALNDLLPSLTTFARKNGVFAVKIEPELEKSNESMRLIDEMGLLSVKPIQPHNSTVLLDISPKLDDIMAGLNQKGRHALRRAERDGVTVEQVDTNDKNCRLFYKMLAETAKAHSFVVRPYDYQSSFWRRYTNAGLGQLFFAYHEGTLITCGFAMVFGKKSLYKDGASIREKTVYGASHLLQWHMIQWAKKQGSKTHDLGGAPPSDKVHDEKHHHYGIGRFKTSFNKQVTDYVGAYDLPIKPIHYKLWQIFAERLTLRHWWRKHHQSWY